MTNTTVWTEGAYTAPTEDTDGSQVYTSTYGTVTVTIPKLEPTTPPADPTYAISGKVTDSKDTAVEGATVKLMRGNAQFGETATTDAEGLFSFDGVKPGVYNIVATKDGVTMTKLVTVTNADLTNQTLTMPDGNVSSVLDVKPNTPDVVVGGLEQEAAANAAGAGAVTVTMTVETKEETDADTAPDIAKIKETASGKTLAFLAITVEKQVDDAEAEAIEETTNPLTIIIPFDRTGKKDVTVYRCHGDAAEALPTVTNADGEYFTVSDAAVTVYAKKFSTYAIGYTESAEVNYTVTFNSQGGSAVASQTVAQNGKVTRPANPTRSGYSFGGWYKEAVCATAWNFSTDTVTGNTTLYAKWTASGGSSTGGGGGYSSAVYPINISGGIPNGAVSVSPSSAGKGNTVTITVTPDEGYEIDTVTVTDKDGKEISVTGKGDGKYTFIMPAGNVTISASFTKIRGSYANCPKDNTCPVWPYTDADITAWYHDGVHYCVVNGLMVGYDGHTFGPDGDTSRAMVAMILWRLEGSPVVNYILPFDDVAEGVWYTEAIRWASASGVVSGYGNGKFGPGDPITREQLAAMLYRYEQYKGGGFTGAWMFPLNFTDAELVSSWAYEPMCWTTMNGIINGIGNGQLDPKGKATRAQVATMIMRFCEKI